MQALSLAALPALPIPVTEQSPNMIDGLSAFGLALADLTGAAQPALTVPAATPAQNGKEPTPAETPAINILETFADMRGMVSGIVVSELPTAISPTSAHAAGASLVDRNASDAGTAKGLKPPLSRSDLEYASPIAPIGQIKSDERDILVAAGALGILQASLPALPQSGTAVLRSVNTKAGIGSVLSTGLGALDTPADTLAPVSLLRSLLPQKTEPDEPVEIFEAAPGLALDAKAATPSGAVFSPAVVLAVAHNTVGSGVIVMPEAAIVDRHLDLARGDMWLDNLARDIAATAIDGGKLRFGLVPERLGRLEVEVTCADAGVSVHMKTSSEDARTIVAAAQSRLADDLRGQGTRVVSTEVTTQTETGSRGQPQHNVAALIEAVIPEVTPQDPERAAPASGRFA